METAFTQVTRPPRYNMIHKIICKAPSRICIYRQLDMQRGMAHISTQSDTDQKKNLIKAELRSSA